MATDGELVLLTATAIWEGVLADRSEFKAVGATRGNAKDALHFWRAGESLAALSSLPAHHLNYMQLCDGAAQRPESEQELIRQARSARNVPGEGGLDLHGLMSALPATLPVSLEVPLDGEQGALPPLQRAQLLFDAAQPYLRACA